VFHPAYNDLKGDFLRARRKFKTDRERKWLGFCFGLHVSLMVGNCFWVMCSDKVKTAILKLLFRKFGV